MTAVPRISIIGSGLMGPGIAASGALAGNEIVLCDRNPDHLAAGIRASREYIRQLVDGGIAHPATATRAESAIRGETDLSRAVPGAFWIIEAIDEDLALKQELFRKLDGIVPRDVILSSNTSGLRISDIAKYARERGRTVTSHFWYPAHLVPLVEVVIGDGTLESVAIRLRDLLLTWGKAPVIVRRDLPGQLANRILQAIIREASAIVESGLASAEDVDTAVKMGMGLRFPAWGPLEHVDTVGLELCLSVQESVLPSLYNEPHAVPLFGKLLAAGNAGVKAGKGFHDWGCRSHADLVARRDHFLIQALRILKRDHQGGNPGAAGPKE
ncbi:MAG TPA: 3-hydroxyacyl-CoA dehydrogenase NAD-binding domain-containing protein [Rectinemataceae bacterium]|nr:3-hydroxyacyl-CoA dehydrogenase NAD-binding domain-containing protein [Rectinemataceae bacterium]